MNDLGHILKTSTVISLLTFMVFLLLEMLFYSPPLTFETILFPQGQILLSSSDYHILWFIPEH